MKQFFMVEKGIFMNGMEWDFSTECYFSSFEKAVEYLKNNPYEDVGDPVEVNDNYWRVETDDCESKYGIMRVELDTKPWYLGE